MIAKCVIDGLGGEHLDWWCPGCESLHSVPVNCANGWEWDRNLEAPTLAPSILVHPHRTLINDDLQEPALTNEANIRMTPLCHSFMRAGRIQFLSDCTHYLADQTVPMGPIPEGWS